ncbi:unnamed protein product [Coregonus sp. 'balchen']|nr:unnamed protein product [Coregonus sp. 'balchen']
MDGIPEEDGWNSELLQRTDEYKNGLGHVGGEYKPLSKTSSLSLGQSHVESPYVSGLSQPLSVLPAGLGTIHLPTRQKNYKLKVDIKDFDGRKVYANYYTFSISPKAVNAEVDGYRLVVSSFRNGGAG